MLSHRGFSAWLVVDGKPVPEHLVAVDTELNRVSCWVPSEEGKSFSIHWTDHGGKLDTCSFITLDGFVVPGRFLFGDGTTSREGVRTSGSTERPFVFKKVGGTVSQSPHEGATKEVGMIILRIKQIVRVDSKLANPILDIPETILGKRKAGDHCIGFGEERETEKQLPSTWSVAAHDKNKKASQPSTYVSFVFRYRSQEFLEAQGIATEQHTEPIPLPNPQRAPVRRVVSMPSCMPSLDGEAPRKKKPRLAPVPSMPSVPHLSKPQLERRTVSCKADLPRVGVKNLPGQGLLVFDHLKSHIPVEEPGDSSTEPIVGPDRLTGLA